MKALILAAGYGTRLEPLTKAIPKPMVPIVNLPTMQHNLELLKKYGFKEIITNIHYFPEQIENYFGDGSSLGINLSYSYEEELLGTAGGVKRMAELMEIKETFLVLSSDALTDINLHKIIEFHKKKKALATIALSLVEDVSDFGVVVIDKDNRIVGFQEKPKKEEVVAAPITSESRLVNAGIYVFEPEILNLIPDGFHDFGKQLFPRLVEEKAPFCGYRMVEYWSDVGGLEKYIQSNYDAMKGLVRIHIPGKKVSRSSWIGERGKIDRSAHFEGSVIIGDRCSIGKNVYIKDAVIGDKCTLGDNSIVAGSVIWSDTVVESEVQISKSVIGNFCHIGQGSKIEDGIAANCSIIRKGTQLPSSTRLEPNSIV